MARAKKEVDPFNVVTSKPKSKSSRLDEVKPSVAVQGNVDEYVQIKSQIKDLEGQLSEVKCEIEDFARTAYAQRAIDGRVSNFKVLGQTESVSWIATNSSSNIDSDCYDNLVAEYGKKVVDALVQRDVATVRFDAEVYERHKDKINAALVALNKQIGENLFTSVSYKVTKTVLADAPGTCKNADQLESLLRDLKVKAYIKG